MPSIKGSHKRATILKLKSAYLRGQTLNNWLWKNPEIKPVNTSAERRKQVSKE